MADLKRPPDRLDSFTRNSGAIKRPHTLHVVTAAKGGYGLKGVNIYAITYFMSNIYLFYI